MILEFKMKNYRSYKNEVVFSMLADSSRQKKHNVSELELNGQQAVIRTLKTAIIYGANASGKTNVVRALYYLLEYILEKPKVDQRITLYDPFLFDNSYVEMPMEVELTFIGPSSFKYIYSIKLNATEVLAEELIYYPSTQPALLFKREPYNPDKTIQTGKLGASLKYKEISIFKNQLLLSKFGDDEPDETLSEVYLHFKKYFVFNAVSSFMMDDLLIKVNKEVNANPNLKLKLERLISAADTKIIGIHLEEEASLETKEPERDINHHTKKANFSLYGVHEMFHRDGKINETYNLNMRQESKGTRTFYILAGTILSILEKGGLLVVDELDTSLHPFITKLIVTLFQSERTNPKHAQLIFTTHDVSLLDRELVRKDQIWFAEKSQMGTTDLYSLQDFDNLREDTPFEKWYLAGKFGGLPNVMSIESIFNGTDEN
jgi:AAA15 family ATPase/GTPase